MTTTAPSTSSPQHRLDPVANRVRLRDLHLPRHDQVEVDEGRPAGVPGPHVVRLERALTMLSDQRLDPGQQFGRDRLIHEPADRGAYQAPARPQDVDPDQSCECGVEDQPAGDGD
jgi:hypothetical protein